MNFAHPALPQHRDDALRTAGPTKPHHVVPLAAGRLVMGLLLASLSMGFGAVFAFYFIMRARAPVWPPTGTPALPPALWLSTALIVASSLTLHAAVRAARRGTSGQLRRAALATFVLAFGFVLSQALNWVLAYAAHMPPYLNMFTITFYLFTGLHGLHVLGGLVPLAVVAVRAGQSYYTPAQHAGLTFAAWYWHFVDVVWLLMFATLLLST